MLELINQIFVKVNELSQHNQAIALAISAYGLGTLAYFTRDIPKAIYDIIRNNTVVSLEITNEGTAVSIYNLVVSNISSLRLFNISRKYGIPVMEYWDQKSDFERNPRLVYAGGKQFFFYEGRLFWLGIDTNVIQGRNQTKYTLTIHTFGRSEKSIEALAKFIFGKHASLNPEKGYRVYSHDGTCWDTSEVYRFRPVASVITHGNIAEDIIREIEEFQNNKEWYVRNGFNYKLVIMLHGPTGTGKTSIVKAVASHFNKNIFTGSIVAAATKGVEYFRAVDKGGLCLFEDFDSEGISNKRDNLEDEGNDITLNKDKDKEKNNLLQELEKTSSWLLGKLLNTLDGVDSVEDSVIFMTTNCYDDIDPALKRPGRVDLDYYVGYLDDGDIRRYIAYYYQDQKYVILDNVIFEKTPGCVLYELFREHKNNPDAFIDKLEKTYI